MTRAVMFFKEFLTSESILYRGNFSDEEKKGAKQALLEFLRSGFDYYEREFGLDSLPRYDFHLKRVKRDRREINYLFEVIDSRGRETTYQIGGDSGIFDRKKHHRTIEDALEEIPVDAENAYRGLSFEEFLNAKQRGFFVSSGMMNIGSRQQGYTFFGSDPGTAAFYSTEFQPLPRDATRSRPGVVIEVSRQILEPAHLATSPITKGPVGEKGEFVTSKAVSLSSVVNLYLLVPHTSKFGSLEIIHDLTRDKYRKGLMWPPRSSYIVIKRNDLIR